jgi:uncharacterized protein
VSIPDLASPAAALAYGDGGDDDSRSIGRAEPSREEVALLGAAAAAGATRTVRPYHRPFGVYSGYFQDPDGHLWETLWNPVLVDV